MEENKLTNINEYAEMLIRNRSFRNKAYREYVSNGYSISNVNGNIMPCVLKQLICCAKSNRKIRDMLFDILYYVNTESVTDENFQLLLRFPKKYRNTYLSNICHAELSFYQMQIINRYPVALEAFAWLFDKICAYDCFSKEDMLSILRENPDVKPIAIMDCINFALNKYGSTEKTQAAQSWIKRLE